MPDWFAQNAPKATPSGGNWFASNAPHGTRLPDRRADLGLPMKPASADDFTTRGWPATIGDVALGALKGVGSSVANIVDLGGQAGVIPGMMPGRRDPAFTVADELLAPTNTAQQVGKVAETVAEVAVPVARAASAVPSIVKAGVSRYGEPIARSLVSDTPVLTQVRKAVLGKILGRVLDAAKPSANAGGRLVRGSGQALDDELAAALDELRMPAPAPSVELPPSPTLPPGYTPRTSAPTVRPTSAPAPAPAPAPAAAQPPARPYFLKSQEDIDAARAAREALTARGQRQPQPLAVTDLPMSWRPRVDQDVFPMTGADMQAAVADAAAELASRGLSKGEAIAAVSRNRQLPSDVRAQLLRALRGS